MAGLPASSTTTEVKSSQAVLSVWVAQTPPPRRATFNGKPVFEADWNPAISANPYQSFFYKASETGEFTFTWKDDDGSEYTAKNKLTVG